MESGKRTAIRKPNKWGRENNTTLQRQKFSHREGGNGGPDLGSYVATCSYNNIRISCVVTYLVGELLTSASILRASKC